MRTEFFPWIRYCTRIFCKLYILYKVPRRIQNSKSSATSKFSSYRSAPSMLARIITALCAIGFFIKNEFWISAFVSGNCRIFPIFPSWSINWKLEPHKIYSGFFSRKSSCWENRSGSATSSLSRRAINSPRTMSRARFAVRQTVKFFTFLSAIIRESFFVNSWIISQLLSVLQSSIMINSKSPKVWFNTLCIA